MGSLSIHLPPSILAIVRQTIDYHSSRRCFTAFASDSLGAVLAESRPRSVFIAPWDREALEVINWKHLNLDALAGVTRTPIAEEPDEFLVQKYTGLPRLSMHGLDDLTKSNQTIIAWSGKDNSNFSISIPGIVSLYDTIAYQDRLCSRQISNLSRPSSRLRILYAASEPSHNYCRQASALDLRRFSPRLLTVHPEVDRFSLSGFDIHEHANKSVADFFYILQHIDVDLIHMHCTMNIYYQAMVTKLISRCPVVVEFNDISSFFFSRNMYEFLFGKNQYTLESYSEDFLRTRMTGLIFQTYGSKKLFLKGVKNQSASIVFPPLPNRKRARPIPKRPKAPYRLVYAGVVSPSSAPRDIFGDIQLLPVFELLLKQGFLVDVYANRAGHPPEFYQDYMYLAYKNSNFRFLPPRNPDDLASICDSCHFGLMLYDFSCVRVGRSHLSTILPTKFMTYLEYGLPIIVSDRLESVAHLVSRYQLGFVIKKGDLSFVSEIVNSKSYEQILESFLAGREQLYVNDRITILESFFSKAAERQL